jgi:hypothetical protein
LIEFVQVADIFAGFQADLIESAQTAESPSMGRGCLGFHGRASLKKIRKKDSFRRATGYGRKNRAIFR